MLITFTSKVHADVLMFGDVAGQLLRAMGEPELPPGILRGDDIRAAASRLRAWLDARSADKEGDAATQADDDKLSDDEERLRKQRVSLKHRALPLLELMDASHNKQVDVIWR